MPPRRTSALLLGILLSTGHAAGQTGPPVIAAEDVQAVAGQSITVPVSTSRSMTIGSSDLILRFDPAILEAITADSRLDGFRYMIDNARGLVTTASATDGPGQAVGAGEALLQVTFRVRSDATAGCTLLTIADGDQSPPDDLAGPVPPVPPVSIAYDSRAGNVCVAACGTCDDDDRCTADACDQTAGRCIHTELLPSEPESVTCRIENLRRIASSPPLPVCRRTCPQALEKLLAKVEDQLTKGIHAARASRCRKRLRAASRTARALERHIVRFAARGAFVPVARGTRLTSEAELLTDRLRALATIHCERGAS